MRIVIDHLTRMHHDHVCVAGVDLQTRGHVRPLLPDGTLTPRSLARNGGPFDVANLVELVAMSRWPKKPHVEDRYFHPSAAKLVETFGPDEFWALLFGLSKRRLQDVFGCPLRRAGRSSAGVDVGQGTASLGCLIPRRKPALYLRAEGQYGPAIRMRVDDGELDVWAAVTDLRLYQDDHATPSRPAVEQLRQRLRGPGAVILSVGLTRAFTPSTEKKPMHWLQVNNVHSDGDPTWQLG
jgi:hypothetical protein